jgi:hypothetical protein
MRSLLFAMLMGMVTILTLSCSSNESEDGAEAEIAESKRESSHGLVGNWKAERGNDLPAGEAEFSADGIYVLSEYIDAETKVTRKGEFVLDVLADPATIDLCLEGCNQIGSEFVTLFGIVKLVAEDSVMIQLSDSQERPSEFPTEPNRYTLILTR